MFVKAECLESQMSANFQDVTLQNIVNVHMCMRTHARARYMFMLVANLRWEDVNKD